MRLSVSFAMAGGQSIWVFITEAAAAVDDGETVLSKSSNHALPPFLLLLPSCLSPKLSPRDIHEDREVSLDLLLDSSEVEVACCCALGNIGLPC